ncbi:MAG: hypothetical protein FJ086_08295 [Deltaproteobacteria bacterium]|nr:hypothetical protein [Deltaproteobacteria bacterium]
MNLSPAVLSLLLCAAPAFAQGAAAPQAAPPAEPVAPVAEPAPAAAVTVDAPGLEATAAPTRLGARERGIQFAAGAAATLVTVPAGMLLGGAIGRLSNDYASVAPFSLLTWLVLPAAGAALAEWWMGNELLEGSTRLQPAAWVALGMNLVLVVAAIAGGVNAQNPLHLSLFSLASAMVIPGAVTGAMVLWDDAGVSPAAPPAALLETGRPRPTLAATATLLEVPL